MQDDAAVDFGADGPKRVTGRRAKQQRDTKRKLKAGSFGEQQGLCFDGWGCSDLTAAVAAASALSPTAPLRPREDTL
jgi:hypothetical protein